MLSVFFRPQEPKHLYFNINNALHLGNPPFSPTYKIAGLYAIYKADICYYVGQSKNLPSRIATHLTGKYESADRVDLFYIGENNFGGFYEKRTKSEQKNILENNENWLIQKLQPVENIYVQGFEGSSDQLCDHFGDVISGEDILCSDSQIYLNEENVNVTDYGGMPIFEINEILIDEYKHELMCIKRASSV